MFKWLEMRLQKSRSRALIEEGAGVVAELVEQKDECVSGVPEQHFKQWTEELVGRLERVAGHPADEKKFALRKELLELVEQQVRAAVLLGYAPRKWTSAERAKLIEHMEIEGTVEEIDDTFARAYLQTTFLGTVLRRLSGRRSDAHEDDWFGVYQRAYEYMVRSIYEAIVEGRKPDADSFAKSAVDGRQFIRDAVLAGRELDWTTLAAGFNRIDAAFCDKADKG